MTEIKKEEVNNQEQVPNQSVKQQPQIIQTDVGAKDGQNKCPKCGATEISLNVNNGKLRCHYCRHEFNPIKTEENKTIDQLKGQVLGSGAQNIVEDNNDVITLKCSSCGAEVVIDTNEVTQSRCHWCRNTLSLNQQIPNGAIPDLLLPFQIKKEEAQLSIENFVNKRKFFANTIFKKEFTTANIMGVYLPYMVVDVNGHGNFKGQGEIETKRYTRKSGNTETTYYDADVYDVEREFDIVIDGLTIESSSDKLDVTAKDKTTNVINAIMPFDTENCVRYDSNYIKGFTSEKRDTNIEQLEELVNEQAKDVARYSANDSLQQYDRGVAWENEILTIKGQQWKAAYLPIWLYSYQEVKKNKKTLHYVAVNARTKETMGSVPIHLSKLLGISALIEMLSIIFWWTILIDWDYGWLIMFSGFVYFFIIQGKYRNKTARHTHESETKAEISNLRKSDEFVGSRKKLTNSEIMGVNNRKVFDRTQGKAGLEKWIDKGLSSNKYAKSVMDIVNKDK